MSHQIVGDRIVTVGEVLIVSGPDGEFRATQSKLSGVWTLTDVHGVACGGAPYRAEALEVACRLAGISL